MCRASTLPKASQTGAALLSNSHGKRKLLSFTIAQVFDCLRTLHYEGEGWGLTHDGTSLILSNGTAQLRFLDPETLQ